MYFTYLSLQADHGYFWPCRQCSLYGLPFAAHDRRRLSGSCSRKMICCNRLVDAQGSDTGRQTEEQVVSEIPLVSNMKRRFARKGDQVRISGLDIPPRKTQGLSKHLPLSYGHHPPSEESTESPWRKKESSAHLTMKGPKQHLLAASYPRSTKRRQPESSKY